MKFSFKKIVLKYVFLQRLKIFTAFILIFISVKIVVIFFFFGKWKKNDINNMLLRNILQRIYASLKASISTNYSASLTVEYLRYWDFFYTFPLNFYSKNTKFLIIIVFSYDLQQEKRWILLNREVIIIKRMDSWKHHPLLLKYAYVIMW